MTNQEKRIHDEVISIREASEGGKFIVEGYAAVFGVKSRLIAENKQIFYEVIERGAFDNVMKRDDLDVIACFAHDRKEKMLARYNDKVQTLQLEVDDRGLKYRFELSIETELERYLIKHLREGNLNESSFVFTLRRDDFTTEKQPNDYPLRRIRNFTGLFDVSIVHKGAYPTTDVDLLQRSLQELDAPTLEATADIQKMQSELFNLLKNN